MILLINMYDFICCIREEEKQHHIYQCMILQYDHGYRPLKKIKNISVFFFFFWGGEGGSRFYGACFGRKVGEGDFGPCHGSTIPFTNVYYGTVFGSRLMTA